MENAAVASGASMVMAIGRVRVLAVEEDPSRLTTLSLVLQRRGYIVTAKASPEEALRELRDNPEEFDLVMTAARRQGPGIDGFELLKHAVKRYPVIMFSGFEQAETVMKAILGGACDFLTTPLRDQDLRNIWQHVVRRRLKAASTPAAIADARSSDVVVRQDDTAMKRVSAGELRDDSTTKKNKFNSSPDMNLNLNLNLSLNLDLHAAFVKAAEQLRGTEDYCPRGIRDLLKVQGVEATTEQVTSHLEKYRRDCLTNHLSAMPIVSSSHSNISKNYSTPGSSGFYMRPQGATSIFQTSLLSNGVSAVDCSILGNESYRASHVGLPYNNGNHHDNANGNCSGKYDNGYDYQYANGNGNDNANNNGCDSGNGRGGVLVHASMVSASLTSNLAQQVYQAMPEGYGNGCGGLNMVSASVQSNLAQPVQQAIPTNSLFPSTIIPTMDNPNTMGQQEFPRISQLRYDCSNGGISMSPCPVDDGEELLRSYLQSDNEVMQNTASIGMTQGIHGDGAAGQISAPQPEDPTDLLSWESSNGNGAAGTSGGSGDGILDREFSADEMEKFFNLQEYIECDNSNVAYDELARNMMRSPA